MPSIVVCPACDLAHHAVAASSRAATRCARCGALLQRPENGNIDTAIAVAICALVLFLLTNAYPLVGIQYNGTSRDTTLAGAALSLYRQNHAGLACLVFTTTVLSPLLQIAGLLYLLIPLRRGRQVAGLSTLYRLLTEVRPWIFVEVFMLGTLVALVRLSAYARVVPGVAIWSCGLLMFALAALSSRTAPAQFWRWVEEYRT